MNVLKVFTRAELGSDALHRSGGACSACFLTLTKNDELPLSCIKLVKRGPYDPILPFLSWSSIVLYTSCSLSVLWCKEFGVINPQKHLKSIVVVVDWKFWLFRWAPIVSESCLSVVFCEWQDHPRAQNSILHHWEYFYSQKYQSYWQRREKMFVLQIWFCRSYNA